MRPLQGLCCLKGNIFGSHPPQLPFACAMWDFPGVRGPQWDLPGVNGTTDLLYNKLLQTWDFQHYKFLVSQFLRLRMLCSGFQQFIVKVASNLSLHLEAEREQTACLEAHSACWQDLPTCGWPSFVDNSQSLEEGDLDITCSSSLCIPLSNMILVVL